MNTPPGDRWADDVGALAINAILGGLASGLQATLSSNRDFSPAFSGGALGGAIGFAGKRLATERVHGAGLVGRQIASLGTSIASNARDGHPLLERLVFSAWGGRVYWDRNSGQVTPTIDLHAAYWTIYGLASSQLTLQVGSTLSMGTSVFHTSGDIVDVNGLVIGSQIFVQRRASSPLEEIEAHEIVHVLQMDQGWGLWGRPIEQALRRLWPRLDQGFFRYLEVSVTPQILQAGLGGVVPDGSNLFEVEAELLGRHGR